MKLTKEELDFISNNLNDDGIEKIRNIISDAKRVDLEALGKLINKHIKKRDEEIKSIKNEAQIFIDSEIILTLPWNTGDILIDNHAYAKTYYVYLGVCNEKIKLHNCDRHGAPYVGDAHIYSIHWSLCNNLTLYKEGEQNESKK